MSLEYCTNFVFNLTFPILLFALSTTVAILSKTISFGTPPKYLKASFIHLNRVFWVLSDVNFTNFVREYPNTIRKIFTSKSSPCFEIIFRFSFQSTCA